MVRKMMTHLRYPLLIAVIGLCLVALAWPATGNIDPTDKWAWGTNIGWINFAPTDGGVTVYSDHLEGDAWGERIGWIRLGTAGSGDPYYDNTAADNYGVNNDGCGNLSGYAWGTNTRWINFNPSHSQVTVDPVTGDFDGYAWGENIGWIHFQNASPAYKVQATSTGNLTTGYANDIAALITTRRPGPASSSGLTIGNTSFLNDSGDCIVFGHNNQTETTNTYLTDIIGTVKNRWAREWELDKHDVVGTANGNVILTFDFSEAGRTTTPDADANKYRLIKRADSSSNFSIVATASSVSGDQVSFSNVDASNLGSLFTLGTTEDPLGPNVVTLRDFTAPSADGLDGLALLVGLVVVGVGGLGLFWRRVRRR